MKKSTIVIVSFLALQLSTALPASARTCEWYGIGGLTDKGVCVIVDRDKCIRIPAITEPECDAYCPGGSGTNFSVSGGCGPRTGNMNLR